MSIYPQIGQFTEDEFKKGSLKQPSYHDHYFLHPKQTDPISKQIWECHDAFYDHHWYFGNVFKYAFKGLVLGGLFGGGISLVYKQLPTMVLKKMSKYVKENNFGSIKLARNIMTPYAVGGAVTGASWYIWYHLVWTQHSTKGPFLDNVGGYGIFGSVATAFLFGPKHYWAGFWVGSLIGFASWFVYESNNYGNKNSPGYYIPLGEGLSEEEQIAQRNKDIVFELSQLPEIKFAENYKGL